MFDITELPLVGQALGQAQGIMDPNSKMSQAAGAFLPQGYLDTIRNVMGGAFGDLQNGKGTQDIFKHMMASITGMPWEHVSAMAQHPHVPLWDQFPGHYQRPGWANQAANGQVQG